MVGCRTPSLRPLMTAEYDIASELFERLRKLKGNRTMIFVTQYVRSMSDLLLSVVVNLIGSKSLWLLDQVRGFDHLHGQG